MSDDLNWNAICISAAAMGIQYGAVFYDLWKRYKRPRPIETGYEKVGRGETVEGWTMVISPERIRKKHNQFDPDSHIIFPPWLNDDAELPAIRHGIDLLLAFIHTAPDGRTVYVLARYSLIADVDTMIARIVYKKEQWVYRSTFYLTHRVAAAVFRNRGTDGRYRVVLADNATKRHQIFTIERPFEVPMTAPHMVTIRRCGLSQNQLSVVCVAPVASDGEARWEFSDTIYEIPSSDIDANFVVKASSCEELSIPVNGRDRGWSFSAGLPTIAVIYDDNAPNVAASSLVVSFEKPGNWQITPFLNWLASFRSTSAGSRHANAVDAFGSLSPPESHPLLQRFDMRYYGNVRGSENGSATYAASRGGGIMRRWIKPPSLQYLAAEALCRANPNIDRSQLKDLVGFDLFEGMSEDGANEENASTIML